MIWEKGTNVAYESLACFSSNTKNEKKNFKVNILLHCINYRIKYILQITYEYIMNLCTHNFLFQKHEKHVSQDIIGYGS